MCDAPTRRAQLDPSIATPGPPSRVIAGGVPGADALARELDDYERRITGPGRAVAGAFKAGTHDDMAAALGLALVLPYRTHRTYELLDPSDPRPG